MRKEGEKQLLWNKRKEEKKKGKKRKYERKRRLKHKKEKAQGEAKQQVQKARNRAKEGVTRSCCGLTSQSAGHLPLHVILDTTVFFGVGNCVVRLLGFVHTG